MIIKSVLCNCNKGRQVALAPKMGGGSWRPRICFYCQDAPIISLDKPSFSHENSCSKKLITWLLSVFPTLENLVCYAAKVKKWL